MSVPWGILSTAAILEEMLPAFEQSEVAELRAIASRDLSRAEAHAAEHGIPVSHGSYEALLADDSIECVYIALPNSLHGEWTRAAIEAGKHVLCEKPLTPTAEEARSLFELAEERGVVLMEAFMYRHHPKTRRLRELCESGEIGVPRVVRMKFHFKTAEPETDIRYDPELAGGALRDVGCYCVSMASYLAGAAPDTLTATARMSESGIDEQFSATLGFDNELLAVFDCGMYSPVDVGVEVLGTDGRAIGRDALVRAPRSAQHRGRARRRDDRGPDPGPERLPARDRQRLRRGPRRGRARDFPRRDPEKPDNDRATPGGRRA